MIEDRTLRTATRTVADYRNKSTAGPRGPILRDDFQLLERFAHGEFHPRFKVISGSAVYDKEALTIDVADYAEIKTHPATIGRTHPFLSSVAGPLVTFAAATVVAITLGILPAPDRPIFPAGPLAGHSLLHFPR